MGLIGVVRKDHAPPLYRYNKEGVPFDTVGETDSPAKCPCGGDINPSTRTCNRCGEVR